MITERSSYGIPSIDVTTPYGFNSQNVTTPYGFPSQKTIKKTPNLVIPIIGSTNTNTLRRNSSTPFENINNNHQGNGCSIKRHKSPSFHTQHTYSWHTLFMNGEIYDYDEYVKFIEQIISNLRTKIKTPVVDAPLKPPLPSPLPPSMSSKEIIQPIGNLNNAQQKYASETSELIKLIQTSETSELFKLSQKLILMLRDIYLSNMDNPLITNINDTTKYDMAEYVYNLYIELLNSNYKYNPRILKKKRKNI
jgi:hypothetical protein